MSNLYLRVSYREQSLLRASRALSLSWGGSVVRKLFIDGKNKTKFPVLLIDRSDCRHGV